MIIASLHPNFTSTYHGLIPVYHSALIVFKCESTSIHSTRKKALVGVFSVIVKTSPMVRLQL